MEQAGEWTVVFLAFLRKMPNVMRAAKAAGVSRAMAYKERDADPWFREQWDEAIADAIENIEAVALDLAKLRDPKHNGLRMFMLKSHKREQYGDRGELMLKGSKEAPIRIEVVNRMQTLTEEEFALLERLRDKLDGPAVDADQGGNLLGAGTPGETTS